MRRRLYYGDLTNRAHPLNRGLVSWWPGVPWYTSGPRVIDIAGRNHGTRTNSPAWVPAHIPGFGALSFVRASTTTVPITLAANRITSNNAFTFSCWFTQSLAADTSANTDRKILSSSTNALWFDYHDRAGFAPALGCVVRFGFGGPTVSSSTTLAQNTWYHLIYCYASGDQRMYLDGKLLASAATVFTLPNVQTDLTLGSGWDGNIGGVRLYDRALAASEAPTLFREEQNYRRVLNWLGRRSRVEGAAVTNGLLLRRRRMLAC